MADPTRKASVIRFERALKDAGFAGEIVALESTARSAREAARALGVEVAQIVKSLVFRGRESGEAYLVLAAGANRVSESKLERLAKEVLEKPDARFVRERTGFSIGGVPPLGHPQPLETFLDEDLFGYQKLWAAAGHTHAVFGISPRELARITGGRVADLKEV